MADISPSALWVNGKRFGDATGSSTSHDANAGFVHTDGGVLLRKGPSSGTTTINYAVRRTSDNVGVMLRHLQSGDTVKLIEGPVGDVITESHAIVSNVEYTSSHEDGSFTGTAQLLLRPDPKLK